MRRDEHQCWRDSFHIGFWLFLLWKEPVSDPGRHQAEGEPLWWRHPESWCQMVLARASAHPGFAFIAADCVFKRLELFPGRVLEDCVLNEPVEFFVVDFVHSPSSLYLCLTIVLTLPLQRLTIVLTESALS